MIPNLVLHTEYLVSVSGVRRKDISHGAAAVRTDDPKTHKDINLTELGSLPLGDVHKFLLIQSNTRFRLKFTVDTAEVNLSCERLFIAYSAFIGASVEPEPDGNVVTYVDVFFD